MAFTHVRGTSASIGGGTTGTFSLSANPTSGNLVCVGILTDVAVTAMTVVDANSNSYTKSPSSPSTFRSGAGQCWDFYLLKAPANASLTLTVSWTTTDGQTTAFSDEFSATGTISFDKDAEGDTTVAGTAINTPSVTPTNSGSLLWACTAAGGTISSPTAGGTQGVWTGSAGAITNGDMAEYDLSATGATAVNYVQSSGTWSGIVMAFFIAGTVPGFANPEWQSPTVGPSYAI